MRFRYPLLLITMGLWVSGSMSVAATLEDAGAAYAKRDFQGARAAIDTVLSANDSVSETYRIADHNLAILKAQQGDLNGAISKLEAVIASHAVAAAALENIKALRAKQAALSLSRALGQEQDASLPPLLWLSAPTDPDTSNTPDDTTEAALSEDAQAGIERFISDYANALGTRDIVGFLSLYSAAYAPADGNSRATWQLEVVGAFAGSTPYEPTATLTNATPLNDALAVVAFSLHDPRTDAQRPLTMLLQRDATNLWKILSDL